MLVGNEFQMACDKGVGLLACGSGVGLLSLLAEDLAADPVRQLANGFGGDIELGGRTANSHQCTDVVNVI